MRFTVKLTTSTGEVLLRDYECTNEAEVRTRIGAEGGFPLEIRKSTSGFQRSRTVKAEPLIIFNQELLALLKAGIPLLQSLELLVGHGKDANLRSALEKVVELVRSGMAYSEALEQVGAFPAVYRANVVAGERSGTLPEVIGRWLAFQNFAQKSRRRIVEALFYPAFLVTVLVIALVVIFNVVLPKFSLIYNEGGMPMPALTQVLLSFGSFMRKTLWLQGILGAGFLVFLRWVFSSEQGSRLWERFLLAIPKLGDLYRMYHSSVFARTLGILLAGGLPVLQALEVLQRTSSSERMKLKLVNVMEAVRAGTSLHLSLDQSKLLDPLAVEMTRVGEQSSALPDMLNHVADFFDQEVEKATTVITGLIGPVLILFMGVVVLVLLIAIYVPLFEAGNAVH